MNDQFIQGVIFDWNKIDDDSYLKQIEALKDVERLEFKIQSISSLEKNGSGKSTLLEAIAIAHGFNPEGGTKNYVFSTHDTHSELYDAIRVVKGYRRKMGIYFLIKKVSIMLQRRKNMVNRFSQISHERSHGEGFLGISTK